MSIVEAGAITHHAANLGEVAPCRDRRQRMTYGKHGKLFAQAIEEWRGADQERAGALVDKRLEGCTEFAFTVDAQNGEMQAKPVCRLLYVFQLDVGAQIVWIDEHAYGCGLGNKLVQQPEPLGFQPGGKLI